MPSRRDQIRMSEGELRDFLSEQKIVSCATIGPHGRPHLVPLWYVPNGVVLRAWTYAASQKARNLERDPRATLQVEEGVEYQELRGVMLECDVALEHDPARVADYGLALFARYGGVGEVDAQTRSMVEQQAPKRLGMRFEPSRIVTWDHRKLAGTY